MMGVGYVIVCGQQSVEVFFASRLCLQLFFSISFFLCIKGFFVFSFF